MSQLEVDKIIPQSGTTLTIGDSGDTITIASGATLVTGGDISTGNNGSIFILDNVGQKSGQITNDGSSSNSLQIDADPDNSGADTYMQFKIDDSEKARIDASGNLLLNTSSSSGFDAGGLPLLVGNGSTHQGLTIYTGTSHTGAIHFADGTGTGSYRGQVNYRHDTDAMTFATSGSEKARIDASGNLLVGKTNQTANVSGTEIEGSGTIVSTRASNTNLFLNRTGNDGQLINFRKDNSVVGSIGTASGKLNLGTENCQIIFRDDLTGIIPANSDGSNSNNDLNLGHSNVRWKDLYLGNSIDLSKSTNQAQVNIRSTVTPNGSKLGGEINLSLGSGSNSGSGNTSTQVGDILGNINFNGQGTDYSFQGGGIEVQQTTPIGQTNRTDAGCDMIFKVISAGGTGYTEKLRIKSSGGITFNGDTSVNNALDDYEQGTFTPTLSTAGGTLSVTYAERVGKYTKIGNIVTYEFYIETSAFSGGTGSITFSGLPFTVQAGRGALGIAAGSRIDLGLESAVIIPDQNATTFKVRIKNSTGTGTSNNLTTLDASDWSNNNPTLMYGSGHYRTDA
jgi:hypothetical protein